MEKNLAKLSQEEMDKVNVDLAAAGVAFKERYNMPVVADLVEREQPEHLRGWFPIDWPPFRSLACPMNRNRNNSRPLRTSTLARPAHSITLVSLAWSEPCCA